MSQQKFVNCKNELKFLENKKEFKVHFEYTKPAPNTDSKPELTMDLTWIPQNNE